MAEEATPSTGVLPKKLQGYATLFAICLPIFMQYFEPVIEKMTGQDEERLHIMQHEIDLRFQEIDSSLHEGGEFLQFIHSEMDGMKTDWESSKATWRSKPFSIGLKAKTGVQDTLWYKARNGKEYVAIFDPFSMWWKYSDPNDWNSPHKAVLFESDWREFEDQQRRMMEAVMYYELMKAQGQ